MVLLMLVSGENESLFIYQSYLERKLFIMFMEPNSKTLQQNIKKVVRLTLKKCDCVIALSESWKNYFESEFFHPCVEVVKNVIDSPQINKIKSSQFILLFLGRIGNRKGIFDLLEVLAKNRLFYEGKLQLFFGGDGEVEKAKEYIKQNKLENIAFYQGWISGKNKIELLNRADAYVLPSYNEGLPVSILESMSYHLPIISTNVGGIPEIVKDGVNGFIIEPGNKKK